MFNLLHLKKYIPIFGLTFVLSFLFLPMLNHPFLSDDYIWVDRISTPNNFSLFFQQTFTLNQEHFLYRPIMPTSLRLCYQIAGITPFCMHLVSFVLHFLNTLLTWRLSYMLTKSKWTAWGAAFFFSAYFPHVESVAWISDLGNPLATFFILITTILFLLFIRSKKLSFWLISIGTFGFALISKESSLALGPILLIWGAIIYLWNVAGYHRKQILIACSSYTLAVIIFLLLVNRIGLNFALTGSGTYAFRFDIVTLSNVIYYSLNWIWPTDYSILQFIYQNLLDITRISTGSNIDTLSSIIAIPGIIWVVSGMLLIWLTVLWLYVKGKLLHRLAISWVILGTLPVIFLSGQSDRHFYVASVGLSLLFGYILFGNIKFFGNRVNTMWSGFKILLFALLLILNISWTQARLQNWKIAGEITRHVLESVKEDYPDLPSGAILLFVNLPIEYNGAHVFRLGLASAFKLELNRSDLEANMLTNIDELPTELASNQFAFLYKDGQLLDLTPNYRP